MSLLSLLWRAGVSPHPGEQWIGSINVLLRNVLKEQFGDQFICKYISWHDFCAQINVSGAVSSDVTAMGSLSSPIRHH